MKLLEITREEVKGKIGVMPIGSVEQHGPHLPMGTDSIVAEWLASQLESKYGDEVVLFPPLTYGCSWEHGRQPFVGISYVTMINFLTELMESARNAGLLSMILVNGHGGNESVLDVVRRQVNFRNRGFKVYLFSMVGRDRGLFQGVDMHAGSVETSRMLFLRRELVRLEKISEVKDLSVKEGVFQTITTEEANLHGVINLGGRIEVDASKGETSMMRALRELEELFLKVREKVNEVHKEQ
ncbi:MAG: creatininase family protein [Candidatus Aramenus sp.]|jgi:creatinine amidohydrolase|nr:creatininase family protein [Candidatus Aramenus sp.]